MISKIGRDDDLLIYTNHNQIELLTALNHNRTQDDEIEVQ